MRQVETDVLIIGGGISAALIAEKLTEERDVDVLVVEAGEHSAPLEQRSRPVTGGWRGRHPRRALAQVGEGLPHD